MVESIAELRRRLQEPVRPYNDVAGMLVGDWVSLPITRAFLKLGWSPTVGTVGMLVFGLAGAALLPFGGGASALGFALVFFYYVLDCVDGEVARYRGVEKLEWAFHEFFFHLLVKSAFFVALGVLAVRTTGELWSFAFGISALLATMFHKFLRDAPLAVICRSALLRAPGEAGWVTRALEIAPEERDEPPAPADEPAAPGEVAPYPSFGGPLATLRVMALNFDLSLLYFLAASLLDLAFGPWVLMGLTVDLKLALYAFYGVALPLHFVDNYATYARGGRFLRDCRELLTRSHHFRADD